MATKEEIIEKIKKLSKMTLDKGCSQAEVDKALEVIKSLMLKYDLCDDDIGAEDFTSSSCKEDFFSLPKLYSGTLSSYLTLAQTVAEAYNGKVFYRAPKYSHHDSPYGELAILASQTDIELIEFMLCSILNNLALQEVSFKNDLKREEIEIKARQKKKIVMSLIGKGCSEFEAELLYSQHIRMKGSRLKELLAQEIRDYRKDSLYSYYVGFFLHLAERFRDIKKAREEQAKSSGYSLVPVGFFDDLIEAKTIKNFKPRKTSHLLNEKYNDGRATARAMELHDGLRAR